MWLSFHSVGILPLPKYFVRTRDRGATLRLGGGGGGEGIISAPIFGGEGTRHFFFLTLYNFKNIGGGGHVPPAPSSPPLLRGP